MKSRIFHTRLLPLLLAVILVLASCGSGKADKSAGHKETEAAAEDKSAVPKIKEDTDSAGKDEQAETSGDDMASEEPFDRPDDENPPSDDTSMRGKSLARRLCGKYSYNIGAGGTGENEYYSMELVSFGDNLYAFCGQAVAGDTAAADDTTAAGDTTVAGDTAASGDTTAAGGTDSLECYSFWAGEFIPDDAGTLRSADSDSADVTVLNFSIMSNAGRYWDSGARGRITLEPQGILFENFGNDGFLVPENDDSRLFLKDERAESAFAYLHDDSASGEADLQGYWRYEGKEAPVYLYFEGSDLYVYRKAPDKEVYLAAGGCDFAKGTFTCRANVLGSGSMPDEWRGEFETGTDTLRISIEGESLPADLEESIEFKRVREEDVHVTVMDEVRFDGDSFGYFGAGDGRLENGYENGFCGIWTSAVKERDRAVAEAEKLNSLGYDSYVCYSPEWENLNGEGYYCVTAGRYASEDEAKGSLEAVKQAGFKDAYIKPSGKRKFTTINYTNFGDVEMEVYSDKVILRNVMYDVSRSWYPELENRDEDCRADFIIDEDTVFDESCETEFFGNYEKGDTPLSWFKKNYDLMETDPDRYISMGPALSGVFEAGIRGSHIERFYGSYWWD